MGRGTDKDTCEITGPDGASYRRGRRRSSEAFEPYSPPAVEIRSRFFEQTVLADKLRAFLNGTRVREIRIDETERDGKPLYTFTQDGNPHEFDSLEQASLIAQELLAIDIFGGTVSVYDPTNTKPGTVTTAPDGTKVTYRKGF